MTTQEDLIPPTIAVLRHCCPRRTSRQGSSTLIVVIIVVIDVGVTLPQSDASMVFVTAPLLAVVRATVPTLAAVVALDAAVVSAAATSPSTRVLGLVAKVLTTKVKNEGLKTCVRNPRAIPCNM